MLNFLPERFRTPMALRVLGAVAVVFLLLLGFVKLGGEIAEGETQAFDAFVLRSLRAPGDVSDPIGPQWFEEMARDITALGGTVVLGLVVVIGSAYLVLKRRFRTALMLFGFIGLGFVLMSAMKAGFGRPRPELVPHRQFVYSNSFPSGHAMGSALTYLTLAAQLARVEADRRVQTFLIGMALLVTGLVGVSRVYLGVHYPTDVIGGWGAGAAWAVLTWLAVERLEARGWLDRRAPGGG